MNAILGVFALFLAITGTVNAQNNTTTISINATATITTINATTEASVSASSNATGGAGSTASVGAGVTASVGAGVTASVGAGVTATVGAGSNASSSASPADSSSISPSPSAEVPPTSSPPPTTAPLKETEQLTVSINLRLTGENYTSNPEKDDPDNIICENKTAKVKDAIEQKPGVIKGNTKVKCKSANSMDAVFTVKLNSKGNPNVANEFIQEIKKDIATGKVGGAKVDASVPVGAKITKTVIVDPDATPTTSKNLKELSLILLILIVIGIVILIITIIVVVACLVNLSKKMKSLR